MLGLKEDSLNMVVQKLKFSDLDQNIVHGYYQKHSLDLYQSLLELEFEYSKLSLVNFVTPNKELRTKYNLYTKRETHQEITRDPKFPLLASFFSNSDDISTSAKSYFEKYSEIVTNRIKELIDLINIQNSNLDQPITFTNTSSKYLELASEEINNFKTELLQKYPQK